MTFAELAIGDTFVFASEEDPRFTYSGICRGPWKKISARKYQSTDDRRHFDGKGKPFMKPLECRVGTTRARVIKK